MGAGHRARLAGALGGYIYLLLCATSPMPALSEALPEELLEDCTLGYDNYDNATVSVVPPHAVSAVSAVSASSLLTLLDWGANVAWLR